MESNWVGHSTKEFLVHYYLIQWVSGLIVAPKKRSLFILPLTLQPYAHLTLSYSHPQAVNPHLAATLCPAASCQSHSYSTSPEQAPNDSTVHLPWIPILSTFHFVLSFFFLCLQLPQTLPPIAHILFPFFPKTPALTQKKQLSWLSSLRL